MKKSIITLLFGAMTLVAGAQQYTVSGKAPEGIKNVLLYNVTTRKADTTVNWIISNCEGLYLCRKVIGTPIAPS